MANINLPLKESDNASGGTVQVGVGVLFGRWIISRPYIALISDKNTKAKRGLRQTKQLHDDQIIVVVAIWLPKSFGPHKAARNY
jgi:hypothetical protein